MAGEIFISYRRLDSAIFSQWLSNQLRLAYGHNVVFIDTENIRDAEVWAARIAQSLERASLVIVIIGRGWLSIKDEFERRRIDRTDDWVRQELEASFRLKKTVLPLLIDNADLPAPNALPEPIARLADVQARRINVNRISQDITELVKEVGELIGRTPVPVEIVFPPAMLRIEPLSEENLARLSTSLPSWRVVSRSVDGTEKLELRRTYQFESFDDVIHFMSTAARFIDKIDHHPDWTNVWRTLVVHLTTWDIGHKPSMLDVDLAVYLDNLYKSYERRVTYDDLKGATLGVLA